MYISGLMVRKPKFQYSGPRCFPGGQNMDLLFNSDIVNLLLKTNRGRDRRPNFAVFVVWSAHPRPQRCTGNEVVGVL